MAEQAGQQLVIAFVGTQGGLVAKDALQKEQDFSVLSCVLSVPAQHGPGLVIIQTFSEAVTVTVKIHLQLCSLVSPGLTEGLGVGYLIIPDILFIFFKD